MEVRGVNGDGPRCGCGEQSALHLIERGDPDRDYFLCAACTTEAIEEFLLDRPSFGPCARTDEWWHTDDCKYCAVPA